MNFDLNSYIEKRQTIINDALNRYLPDEDKYPSEIYSAMRYSVFAGGKRLRPVLALASVETVGEEIDEDVLKVATAVEFIHTYSLIHDDLPAMDDDDYRRGNLTCHKVYGEAIAILAGDALLTYAFELLSTISTKKKKPIQVIKVINEISSAVGFRGMIAGQVLDFLAEKNQEMHSASVLEFIHRHKTGTLFQAAVKSGAIIAGADEEEIDSLSLYAAYLGLAFQIVDDILDIEGEASELGKTTGKDQEKLKMTYPAIYGTQKSKQMADDNIRKAIDNLKIFGDKAIPLTALAEYTLARKS